ALRARRCVVPVSGFYEWKKADAGDGAKAAKHPYYITPAEGKILALAGLWERWERGETVLETFTIITTAPNAMMAELHDRMPAVLDPPEIGGWLDAGTPVTAALSLLGPAPDGSLDRRRVGMRVNSARNNGPELIDADPGLF
ncbi:MAG TPA: SOS response-associated peptidase, partial [Phycisphaerales bacterium]|nr:SOS response-associated peptidase [Phycisphaerales bacterium]